MLALIDCNNFYVSCERVFNPKLKGKAVVILSNNDGCVISRSNEAKPLVKMGDPIFLHKKLILEKKLLVYSSNFSLYGDMSNRVMQTIAEFGFDHEIYSIDEAFLKLDCKDLFIAWQIKERIKKNTGIPVSIGIGPTKTLAKIASDFAKKERGVLILDDSNIDDHLQKTPIEDIWGIGCAYAKILKKININNAKEFKDAKIELIKAHLKTNGVKIYLELNGTVSLTMNGEQKKKSILSSRSFKNGIGSFDLLEKALCNFTAIASEKLRAQKSLASYITVFICTNRFNENFYTNQYTIGMDPTDYTPDLLSKARLGLKKIFKKDFCYKRAGIMLTNLLDKKNYQLDLFSKDSIDKKDRAMQVLDEINDRFSNALIFASQGHEKFLGKQTQKTPRYTTCWQEILQIS